MLEDAGIQTLVSYGQPGHSWGGQQHSHGIQHGRKNLRDQDISQEGPYQSPMEDGVVPFHEWLRRQIGPHL